MARKPKQKKDITDLDTPIVSEEEYYAEFERRKKKGYKDWKDNENRDVGTGMPRQSKSLKNASSRIRPLVDPAMDIIASSLTGDLIPHKEVFTGDDDLKEAILKSNSSASFSIEIYNGKEVQILTTYSPVSSQELSTAKWVIQTDSTLKTAAENSRLKKLEVLVKEYRAKELKILPSTEQQKQEEAKKFGGPKKIDTTYDPAWEELPTAEDFYSSAAQTLEEDEY